MYLYAILKLVDPHLHSETMGMGNPQLITDIILCMYATEQLKGLVGLTMLHSEWPKLHRVLAILSAIGLRKESTSK